MIHKSEPYQCFNRPDFKPTLEVQDGWFNFTADGFITRLPIMKVIPFRGNIACSYGNDTEYGRNDTRCDGCSHRWNVPKE